MSQTFSPYRNEASNARAAGHIATLRAAIAALEPEAQTLIEAMIVLLSVDEHFVFRLHNAAAGLR